MAIGYGDKVNNLNQVITDSLVETVTGMSTDDYVQQTTTTDFTWPMPQYQMMQQMKQKLQAMETQKKLEEAQMRQELNTPFDETDDFRDYVVWLCGYTQRKTPPTQEEWDDLRNETKKVAAKFALRTRTKRALAHGVADAYERTTYSALSGNGIVGNQTFIR